MASRSRKADQGARAQVETWLREASTLAARDPEGARSLVTKARKAASRKRISLRAHNRTHCRKCCAWFTSKTLRVRVHPTHTVYACLACGHVTRLRKTCS